MEDIDLKIESALSIIRESKNKQLMKRNKNKRMVAIKKCSNKYINQFVDNRNYINRNIYVY